MAENDDDKDDKTEEATPRRRDEAREQGQVALSQDVIGAASLLVAVLALMFGGAQLAAATGALIDGSIALLPEWGAASFDEQVERASRSGHRRSKRAARRAMHVPSRPGTWPSVAKGRCTRQASSTRPEAGNHPADLGERDRKRSHTARRRVATPSASSGDAARFTTTSGVGISRPCCSP